MKNFCPSVWYRLGGVALWLGLLLSGGTMTAADLSNLNITRLSNVRPTNGLSYGDVWAEGDIACLGVWLGYSSSPGYGVGIYNIANPAAPQLLGIYNPLPISQNQFELGALRNGIGYFGSWSGGGVHIVSMTNPAAPVLLSRIGATTGTVINGFDRVHTIFLERNFLYEAAHVAGITTVKVFDISNPFLPVYLQDIQTTNTTKVHQITVGQKGGQTILYTSGWGGASDGDPNSPGQTDIWDVSNVGSQPAQWLGRIYSGSSSHSSWPTPDGNTLVMCRETTGGEVRIYDISNPGAIVSNAPPLVMLTPASFGGGTGDIPHNPVVVGNLLFISWYQNGIQVFDISDRTKPKHVGFYDTFPGNTTTGFQGNWGVFPKLGINKLLLSDIQTGLYIMDASAVLTATNYAPLLLQSPTGLTAAAGTNVTFTVTATGSNLRYQWQLNGSSLAGATNSSLTLNSVAATHAGNYQVVVSNTLRTVTSANAALSVIVPEGIYETLFQEDFDSGTASNRWNVFAISANGLPDYTADWDFDYSTYFSSFHNTNILAAPGTTNGTTRGLKLTVNKDDFPSVAGVSLYPTNQFFSGAYRLRFDVWINYPGAAGGSAGSTENFSFGLNHLGIRANVDGTVTNGTSDGVWFALDGEGGVSTDYRGYSGVSSGSPLLNLASTGVLVAGASSRDSSDSYWQSIFPSPTYETPGAPGKNWVQVELSQSTNNFLTWRINGNLIAVRTNSSAFTNGNVMLGYMDLVTGVPAAKADSFVLFDNVRVERQVPLLAPSISGQPQPVNAYPETEAAFSVAVTGTGPLAYQWRLNGVNIGGATNSDYVVPSVMARDIGFYSVLVSNVVGVTVSGSALLTMIDSPYLSGVQAVPGERSALVTWHSTVPSGSQVQYGVADGVIGSPSSMAATSQSGFSRSSFPDATPTTNHTVLLTGLEPNTLYSFQTLSPAGTNTYVSGVYQFTTTGEIIVDNPQAVLTGIWAATETAPSQYGTNSLFIPSVTGTATATAAFHPDVPTAGNYDVDVWFPGGVDRASNVPWTISYNGGTTNGTLNQQVTGGGWMRLASGLAFHRGTNGFVRFSNLAGPTVVVADAVRFTYVSTQDFPSAQTVPGWWQDFYFGATVVNPALDADGDGYTTAEEYVLGTDPTDADSRVEIQVQNLSTAASQISFRPVRGDRTYQLVSQSALGQGGWQTEGALEPFGTSDGQGRFNFAITNLTQNFFRLQAQMSTNGSLSGGITLPLSRSSASFVPEATCGPNRVYVR